MQTLIPIQATDGQPTLPGFRLKRLEVLNWGTFHGKIDRLIADCRWTLISGSNGSGKSTAADALRTLLVPPSKLTYNDASVDQKLRNTRKDRTKKTYIRGAYGASSQEDSATAILQFHRSEGEQSSILAVFANEYTGAVVTLAQILWMQNDDTYQHYLIARQDRNIKDHLINLGEGRQVKRQLQTHGFEVFSSFSAYEVKFRSYLGIPGVSALEVFNQVIGVKEVHDLNTFIRKHLLEPSKTGEYIQAHLKPHFTQLSACWEAIQKAGAQLELLKPIAENHAKLTEAEKAKAELEAVQEVLPYHYAQKELELRIALDEELEGKLNELQNEKARLVALQTTAEEQKQSLIDAINNDEVGRRLGAIDREATEALRLKGIKERNLSRIREHLATLHQNPPLTTEEQFKNFRYKLLTDKGAVQGNINTQEQKRIEHGISRRQADEAKERLTIEATSLRENQVLIPHRLLAIRERICQDTGVKPTELPFAGELMEVKEEHRDWTGAIERLLHGLGISMLVPENRYLLVAKYINAAHLGSRLDFFRIPATPPALRADVLTDPRRVPSRLNFKPDSPLIRWVQSEIARRFDHFCCKDVQELEKVEFGITKEGLLRHGTRHTKDDSARVTDRSNFVLGWDTQEKLSAVLKEIGEIINRIKDAQGKIDQTEETLKTLRAKMNAITEILKTEDFSEINTLPEQELLQRLNQEKQKLSGSSNKIRELQTTLASTRTTLSKLGAEIEDVVTRSGDIQGRRGQNRVKVNRLREELRAPPAGIAEAVKTIESLQEEKTVTVDNVETVHAAVSKRIQGRISTHTRAFNEATNALLPAMTDFLARYPEEKADLQAQTEFGSEYVKLRDTIEKEQLPAHKKRFFSLLNRDLIMGLAAFSTNLTKDEEAIRENIASVNASLRNIPFTPDSYVQIVMAPTKSDEVRTFRSDLKACLVGGIQPTEEQQQQIYERIRELITRFDKQPEWTQRVTDVRNWLEYGIRRLSAATNNEVEYYAGSGGKSGGQKSLLALTILASAITSQYGLTGNGDDRDKFRMVVVDEVFGKTDEEYSQRALDLFRKLDLQLVVVNPYDAKSRIVEDYVHSYHLVSAQDEISTIKRASRADYEAARE